MKPREYVVDIKSVALVSEHLKMEIGKFVFVVDRDSTNPDFPYRIFIACVQHGRRQYGELVEVWVDKITMKMISDRFQEVFIEDST